jgi:DNA-nicking Smr family endonuclease
VTPGSSTPPPTGSTPEDPSPDAPDATPPVQIPIEDALDLHAFAPRDVRSVVDEYLQAAAARGFREVRLIHGRGIGVQRRAVRTLLDGHPLVMGFQDAPADRGGWGATVVALRPLPRAPEGGG